MNKKLMFLFLLILSHSAVAQVTPIEEIPMHGEGQPELTQEMPMDEAHYPQMQEDPSYDVPAEVPEDYENPEVIDDPSIEYEN